VYQLDGTGKPIPPACKTRHWPAYLESYVQKLVTLDRAAVCSWRIASRKTDPLDDLGQAILAVAFSPDFLRRHYQLEGHGQTRLAAETSLGALCAVPDGRECARNWV
jgi:hypothetical protein